MCINLRVLQSSAMQDCTQDAGVSIAMNRHTFNVCLNAKDRFQSVTKGEVMERITAV
jgi:hypothetical protein